VILILVRQKVFRQLMTSISETNSESGIENTQSDGVKMAKFFESFGRINQNKILNSADIIFRDINVHAAWQDSGLALIESNWDKIVFITQNSERLMEIFRMSGKPKEKLWDEFLASNSDYFDDKDRQIWTLYFRLGEPKPKKLSENDIAKAVHIKAWEVKRRLTKFLNYFYCIAPTPRTYELFRHQVYFVIKKGLIVKKPKADL
jgi:hypothetical protein